MYCPHCGMLNPAESRKCYFCGSTIDPDSIVPDKTVQTDMAAAPFLLVMRSSIKNDGLAKTAIFTPIFIVLYFFYRLAGKPLAGSFLNSHQAKIEPAQLTEVKNLRKKEFMAVEGFLMEKGFQPWFDYCDRRMIYDHVTRLYCNTRDRMYASIIVKRSDGLIKEISIYGFYANRLHMVVQRYGLPIQLPKNLQIDYLPKASVHKLLEEFLSRAADIPGERKNLQIGRLFKNINKVNQYCLKQGIKEKYLFVPGEGKGKNNTAVGGPCYFHPPNFSVRSCDQCGLPLCDACFHPHGDGYYCEKCLPLCDAYQPGLTPAAVERLAPAGTGKLVYAGGVVRGAAAVIDILIVILLTAAVNSGYLHSVSLLTKSDQYDVLVMLLQHVFMFGFTTYYLIGPIASRGWTLGQKAFGLHVVDRDGKIPAIQNAVVRYSYYLISVIFILPFLGFLFPFIQKNKQGLQDRLAGTYVVTKKSSSRVLAAWIVFICLIGAGVWQGMRMDLPQRIMSFWTPRPPVSAEIYLEPIWEKPSMSEGERYHSIPIGDYWLEGSDAGIRALDMKTGETAWQNNDVKNFSFFYRTEELTHEVLMLVGEGKDGKAVLLDSDTGSIVREIDLDKADFNFIYNIKYLADFSNKGVQLYDMKDGSLLWSKTLDSQYFLSFGQVTLKDRLLLNQTLFGKGDKITSKLTLFELDSGRVAAEYSKNANLWVLSLDNDNIVLFDRTIGKLSLFDLINKKSIWSVNSSDVGLGASKNWAVLDKNPPDILITDKAALDLSNGNIRYKIPEGLSFVSASKDYAIFQDREEQYSGLGRGIVLFDLNTGELIKKFPFTHFRDPFLLDETENKIYLCVYDEGDANKEDGTVSTTVLLCIDKNSLHLEQAVIGKEIYFTSMKPCLEGGVILIPTDKTMGLYKLQMELVEQRRTNAPADVPAGTESEE